VVVHHRIDLVLGVLVLGALLHLPHVHNLVRNAQLAEVALTALELQVKFIKVVKSVIHEGFVPLH
jgi:hypothetical protein